MEQKAHFIPITSTDAIDQLLAQSTEVPILLFNHAPHCAVGRWAYQHVATLPYDVALVNVAEDTQVTHYISLRTGVRHESPQILLLYQGTASWTASHYALTQDAIAEALAARLQDVGR